MRNNSNRRELIVTGGLAVLAVTVSFWAHWLPLFPGDLHVTLLFQSVHSEALLLVMKWVSYVCGSWRSVLLVLAGSIIVWWRLGKLEATLIAAAGLSSLLNAVIKGPVDRPRPTPDLVTVYVTYSGKSFPSGHAFFAAVFLGLVAYFAFTHLRKRGLRMLTLSGFLILILLIGASRVYLGAHWLSDVLGGYLFGAVFLTAFIWFDRVRQRHFQVAKARRPKEDER